MKKYLSVLCVLLMLTSFVSCGDNSSSDTSEVSESSVSETTTEEETEEKTKITTESKTENNKNNSVIRVKARLGSISFKIPDGYEKEVNSSDESIEAVTYKYTDGSMINMARQSGASQFDLYNQDDSVKRITLEALVSSTLENYFDKVGDLEDTTVGGEYAVKQQAVYSGTDFPMTAYSFVYEDDVYTIMFTYMEDSQDEIIDSISFGSTVTLNESKKSTKAEPTAEKKVYDLDSEIKFDIVSLSVPSFFEIENKEEKDTLDYLKVSWNEDKKHEIGFYFYKDSEFYKRCDFNANNVTDTFMINGNKYMVDPDAYIPTTIFFTNEVSSGRIHYDDEDEELVKQIIETFKFNISETEKSTEAVTEKITEKATEPPTEKPAETQPPAVETTPVQTTVHFILNLETNCIHTKSDCRAAQKIDPENYSTVDIAESDLGNYSGTYWACGICSKRYSDELPKF